ncbi:hypothetical protein NIES4101_34960 [Calothrix sp. NIES-4101]|nr:hypothetical protein NIES4101_34960 [Calothrix sp. NIES-4101]
MVLRLNHFDTKTKQETGIEEKLENTLAEYLFPGVEFSIGTAYPEATIPEDLQEYNGKTLQFSAGKRMFFASDSTIREKLYPNRSDGAAYPLPFTPCRSFHELNNVRILVIDDVTGENGGIIANADARKLVGDCKGLIDRNFALSNNIDERAFQFRLGIKPQVESKVMRIAKGTLAPANLEKLGESSFRMGGNLRDGTLRSRFGYDLVLATSSFKGRKGEDAIKPGEYSLSIGLGIKALALYREHRLGTQILVNYPSSVNKEILPTIKQQAEQLVSNQKDIRKLAQHYIETYERRKAVLAKNQGIEPNLQVDIDKLVVFDNLDSGGEIEETQESDNLAASQKDLFLYSLVKADLANYCQLLEHPKVIAELQEFTRKQWVEIATGRSIKFTSGLAQPSLDLQHDEICIPFLGEREEIIVTRSPLINSNGVITLKNKHLPEMLDGCVYIHPQTAMDNMQCDFDGDLLAFAPSRDFPHLAEEVKERNLPENRYPDIIKKDKVAYQGSFAEIAVSAMETKIGIIASEIQKNIALQCEVCSIPQSERFNYLLKISKHFNYLINQHHQGQLKIPGSLLQQIYPIAEIRNQNLDNFQIHQNLHLVKKLFKDCVGLLGNELQIAADGPKSALRPNAEIINFCQAITDYKQVEWLIDKKNNQAFTHKGMKTNGYSPIDLMIRQTNEIFEQNQITARPIEQFRKLYQGIEFSSEQRQIAQQIKDQYNSKIRERIQLEEQQKSEPGPYLTITSPISGNKLKITNLIKFPAAINLDFWRSRHLNIRIEARQPIPQIPHTLFAVAQFKDGTKVKNIPIGTVSSDSVKEHNIKPGMSMQQGKVEFHFGISDGMIDALKQQTREFVESIREEIPIEEKAQVAAAIHDVSHTGESKNYSGVKRAGVTFAVFCEEAIAQLQNLQFTEMRVIGTQFNQCAGRSFAGEKVAIRFEDAANPREPEKTARWVIVEGKKLGIVDARSPQLLAGYEAVASITSPPSTSVIVMSLKNPENKIQIDQINRYAFANCNWQGEQVSITLDLQKTNPRKAPVVFAKIGNQTLGILNKQSVDFLTQQLAVKGRTIQGITLTGTVNKAPPSYADIIIDPDSVKFSESETSNVATVLIINGEVEPRYRERTQQVLWNMLERAIARAVENGFDKIQFVDISPNPTQETGETLQKLAGERKDIEVELIGAKSPDKGMKLMSQPSDIVLGVKTTETIRMIEFVESLGKGIAIYIPEAERFDRRNLPVAQKANCNLQIDR